eukprot:gb/GECH01006249.1/.p1 GENE.gb/GECH01006249.1/~~gb/GECH01006249.1/.p1  ORF type:complete len:2936 (+),score=680.48 gb/GECH01006249.1/:1-8808(+)
MFENIVADLLTKYLGAYVENLDKKDLNISIWKGDLKLKNLKLKRGALDSLNLPISVVHGYLGSLVLKIPWTNLKGKPVIAEIDDLFIVAKPKKSCEWDEKEEEERAQAVKQQKLASFELSKAQQSDGKDEESKQGGFFSAVTQTVINNIQVKIRNVHVRMEDDTTDPKNPFSVGVTLEEISAHSCNSRWEYAFLPADADMVYKLAKLKSFSSYMNHEDYDNILSNKSFSNVSDLKEIMSDMIYDSSSLNYIIEPISGQAKLQMQPTGSELNLKRPKFDVNVEFNQWSANLDDQQYRNLLSTVAYVSNYEQFEKFRKYRPQFRPSRDPRGWWRYACNSVLDSVKQRKKKLSITGLVERRKKKLRYIELYKRTQKVPWLSEIKEGSQDKEEFDKLERELSFDDLLFFRQLANLEIKEEGKRHAKWEEYKKKKQEKIRQKQSWFNWWGGSNNNDEDESDIEAPDQGVQLSQEQRDELYKIVGYEDSKQAAAKYPPDYVHTKVFFSLNRGSLALIDWKTGNDIIQSSIFNLSASTAMSDDNMNGRLTLGSFDVLDKVSKGTCFPKIVSRKESDKDKDLVSVSFEKNPKKGNADMAANLNIKPLDVNVNLDLVKTVLGFFVLPSNINLSALEKAARQQFKTLKERAQEQLELALENRQALDLQVDVSAPNIYIPLDCYKKDTQLAVVDLGRLHVKSDVDKEARKERVQSQKAKEEDFYDKFDLELSDTTVRIGKASKDAEQQQTLLEKTTMKMKLMNCITPTNEGLTKVKVAASINQIQTHVTPHKFELIMRIIDQVNSFTQNPTGEISEDVGIVKGKGLVKGPVIRKPNQTGQLSKFDWHEQHMELLNNRLLIYKHKEDSNPIYVLELSSKAVLDTEPEQMEDGFSNAFVISLPQSDKSVVDFYVYIMDSEYRNKWVSSIGLATIDQDQAQITDNTIDTVDIDQQESKKSKSEEDDQTTSKTQVQLAAAFYLGQVSVTVGNTDNDGEDFDVASFRIEKLRAKLMQRNFDTKFDASLHSVSILDCVGTVLRNNPQYILSSSAPEGSGLGKVSVLMTQDGSPTYRKDSQMYVYTEFNSLAATVEKRPIARLIEYAFELQSIVTNTGNAAEYYSANYVSKDDKEKKKIEQKRKKNEQKKQKKSEKDSRPDMKLESVIQGVSVMLQKEKSKLASFGLSSVSVDMINSEKEMKVKGELGNILIQDYSTKDTHYPEIMSIKDGKEKSLITFDYRQENVKHLAEPAFTKFLDAQVEAIEFVYIAKFVTQLQTYATEGAIMEALQAGSERASEAAKTAVETASQSIELFKMNVKVVSPHVIVPVNPTSAENFSAELGDIEISNQLHHTSENAWYEKYDISIRELNVSSSKKGITPQILEQVNMNILFSRSVLDENHTIPNIDADLDISDMKLRFTKEQYALVFDILNQNIQNTGKQNAVTPEETSKTSSSETKDGSSSDKSKADTDYDVTKAIMRFKGLDLKIFRGNGYDSEDNEDPLVNANIQGMGLDYREGAQKTMNAAVSIGNILMTDVRKNSNNYFKEVINSNKGGKVKDASSCIEFFYEKKANDDQIITLNMTDPHIYFIPEVVLETQEYFTSELDKLSSGENKEAESKPKKEKKASSSKKSNQSQKGPVITGDLRITSSIVLGEDLYLSPKRRLFIDAQPDSDIVVDGQQNTIYLLTANDGSKQPLIVLSPHCKLIFTNVTCRYVDRLEDFIDIAENSTFMALSREGVKREPVEGSEMRMKRLKQSSALSSKSSTQTQLPSIATEEEEEGGRMLVRAELGHPRLMLPQDASKSDSRTLVMDFGASARYTKQKNNEKAIASLKHIQVFAMVNDQQGSYIIEPVNITASMEGFESSDEIKRSIKMEMDAIDTRISYQDLKLVMDVTSSLKKEDESDKSKKESESEEAISDSVTETTDVSELDLSDDEFEDAVELDLEDLENEDDNQSKEQKRKSQETKSKKEKEEEKKQTMQFNFNTQRLGILVVDDYHGYDIPLLDFRICDLQTNANMETEKQNSKIGASLNFQMLANYYNLSLASWETVVESWTASVKYAQRPTYHLEYPTEQIVKVESSTPLNFNVTHSMVDTVLKTSKLWTKGFQNATSESVSSKFGMYLLRNQTGEKIEFWKEPLRGDSSESQTIEAGDSVSFDWQIRRLKDPDAYMSQFNKTRNIFVRLPRVSQEPYQIAVNKVKSVPLVVGKEMVLKADISLHEGKKVIALRSPMKIVNKTTIPLSFRYTVPRGSGKDIGTVEPYDEVGVPSDALDQGILSLLPANDEGSGFEWSKDRKTHAFKEIANTRGKVIMQCHPKSATKSDSMFFVMNIDIDVPLTSSINLDEMTSQQKMMALDYVLTIEPPMSIENLLGCPLHYKLVDKPSEKTSRKEIATGILARGAYQVFYHANIYHDIWLEASPPGQWKQESLQQKKKGDNSGLVKVHNMDGVGNEEGLKLYDKDNNPLILQIDYEPTQTIVSHSCVSIYAPYWIIDKTGVDMQLRNASARSKPMAAGWNYNVSEDNPQFHLFSFHEYNPFGNKVSLQLADSEFSKPFPVDNVGANLEISTNSNDRRYDIAASVSLGPGKFSKTKVITFTPQYVVVNKTGHQLELQQFECVETISLDKEEQSRWFWFNKLEHPKLRMRFADDDYFWSLPFGLTALGDSYIKLIHKEGAHYGIYTAKVSIIQQGATIYAVFKPEPKNPPVRIDNRLWQSVTFTQTDFDKWWDVSKRSKTSYTWDDVNKKQSISLIVGENTVKMNMDKVGKKKFVPLSKQQQQSFMGSFRNVLQKKADLVMLEVIAKGSTKVLRISPVSEDKEKEEEKKTKETQNSVETSNFYSVLERHQSTSSLNPHQDFGIPMVYRLRLMDGKPEVTEIVSRKLRKRSLDSNYCYVMDCHNGEMYVWLGHYSPVLVRQYAVALGHLVLKESKLGPPSSSSSKNNNNNNKSCPFLYFF